MPRFRKPIVKAGVYEIPIPGSSKTRSEILSADRIKYWSETANEMIKEGHRIPGPWHHDLQSLPVKMGSDGSLPKSSDNAGFWDRFWVEGNREDGSVTLWGEIDAPGSENDLNTPAGKIGKTVKETSIYVRPSFKDGSGREWKDALMHVGLVTHPIEKGQENFVPVSEGLALSMSQCNYSFSMSEVGSIDNPNLPTTGMSVSELLGKLKEVARISLPSDTTDVNFLERLNAALEQKRLSEEEEKGTIRVPPKGAQEPPAPMITMSLNQQQIDAIVSAKAVNPDTGKPFTVEELKMSLTPSNQPSIQELQDHPVVKKMVEYQTVLMGQLNTQALTSRLQRAQSIVQKQPAMQKVVDEKVAPLLQSFQMSFGNDGKPNPHPVDTLLDALESIADASPQPAQPVQMGQPSDLARSWLNSAPSHMLPQDNSGLAALMQNYGLAMSQPPQGASEVSPPNSGVVTEEEAEKIANRFLSQSGI